MTAHTTGWQCDMCNASGEIPHPADADIYSMLEKLREAHHAKGPGCRHGIRWVRVWRIDREPAESKP